MDGLASWTTRDIGRFGLTTAVAILDGQPGGVTAAALFQVAQSSDASSRGRVITFIERLQKDGRLTIPPGSDHWTRRRLIIDPKLVDPVTDNARSWIRAAALLFPEMQTCLAHLDDRVWLLQYVTVGGVLARQSKDRFGSPDQPMSLFIGRDGGMAVLCDLFSSQAPVRSRLLEAAPLSRKSLAMRTGVSRTQIQRLLADAAGQGLISGSRDVIHFTEKMSEDAERHFALMFNLTRFAVSVLPRVMARRPADPGAPPARGPSLETQGAAAMPLAGDGALGEDSTLVTRATPASETTKRGDDG